MSDGEREMSGEVGQALDVMTTPRPRIERAGRGGGGALTPFDSSAARAAALKRWEGVSRAARLGLADAGEQIPDVSSRHPLKVVRYLVSQHALNAADPSARSSVGSLGKVIELAYPKPEAERGAAGVEVEGGSLTVTATGAALDALIELARARLAGGG